MDAQTYESWQALHRRVAAGEALTPAERVVYDAGCAELDRQERLDDGIARLRELRARISEAEAEQQRLREREAELDARVAALEARLDQQTRQLLGITG